MSPLHTLSTSTFRDSAFPLPLLSPPREAQAPSATGKKPERRPRILEVAVGFGIVALVAALLVPTVSSRALTLPTATRNLVEHLRLARAGAASRGVHVRVTLQANGYVIEQLEDKDKDGVWQPDSTISVWRISLPPTVTIRTVGETVVEFDARGLITGVAEELDTSLLTVKIFDSQTEEAEVIEILPSGSVRLS